MGHEMHERLTWPFLPFILSGWQIASWVCQGRVAPFWAFLFSGEQLKAAVFSWYPRGSTAVQRCCAGVWANERTKNLFQIFFIKRQTCLQNTFIGRCASSGGFGEQVQNTRLAKVGSRETALSLAYLEALDSAGHP